MPTWSGWIIQFLGRAAIINTPPNQIFMAQWAAHAPGSCKNNPVDLSHSVTGSTRCGDTVAGFGRTQNYGTHGEAAHAFQLSVDTDWVKPLRDALNTGNPFQISDRTPVVDVLNRWGSPQFATWYQNATSSGGTGGGPGGTSKAPHTHSGWKHLQRVVNREIHPTITKSTALTNAALRSLGRTHKVHH